MNKMNKNIIAIKKIKARYPHVPFHPSKKYPEYPFQEIGEENRVYDAVRKLFSELGLDKKNYGTKKWNPFREIIKPGQTVLINPNWIRHYNIINFGLEPLITHGSIIRVIIDYVIMALKGKGRIILGDAPIQSTDFNELIKLSGINEMLNFYKENKIKIELIDFRKEMVIKKRIGVIKKIKLKGDPYGYVAIDLGENSELMGIIKDYKKFRVMEYKKEEMLKYHNPLRNKYLVPNSLLLCDIIINLPKLKVHKKTGITCASKNIVGIIGSKDWLPHYRKDSPEESGDEYKHKSLRKKIITFLAEKSDLTENKILLLFLFFLRGGVKITRFISPFKDPWFEGNWPGNDTLPRTITDLNKIIFYVDKNGKMREKKQRKMFILVDGIIAGEGKGSPTAPLPKKCGLLIAGFNPVAIDFCCAELVGFDSQKIPLLKKIKSVKKYKLIKNFNKIKILFNNKKYLLNQVWDIFKFKFRVPKGWEQLIKNNIYFE